MTNHSLHVIDTASPKIAIIGGGLTGLLTATLLERALNTDTRTIQITHPLSLFLKNLAVLAD